MLAEQKIVYWGEYLEKILILHNDGYLILTGTSTLACIWNDLCIYTEGLVMIQDKLDKGP
jgi:hypothetical protein